MKIRIIKEGHGKEGSMARSQLYRIGKYSAALQNMISDCTNLEEWVESKITKASDYLSAVKHYLEAEMARQTGALEEIVIQHDVTRSPEFTGIKYIITNALMKDRQKTLQKLLPDPNDRKMFMTELHNAAGQILDKMSKKEKK